MRERIAAHMPTGDALAWFADASANREDRDRIAAAIRPTTVMRVASFTTSTKCGVVPHA
jgi:hypothetical protein